MTADVSRPDDADLVKVTTRLTKGQARRMRIEAVHRGITIETAFRTAVTAYLSKNA